MNDLSLSKNCRRSLSQFYPPTLPLPPLPPPVYNIRIDEPSFHPNSRFCVGGILQFVVATANTRRHFPLLPICGSYTLGRFVAVTKRLTMDTTPKKRHRSETGRENAVAFAFSVPVLLLCITICRGHLRVCGGGKDYLPPSPSSFPSLERLIDAYLQEREARSGNDRKVHSPYFFHIRLQ